MIWSRSHQMHLFWWLLLELIMTASLATVSGQTIGELISNEVATAIVVEVFGTRIKLQSSLAPLFDLKNTFSLC